MKNLLFIILITALCSCKPKFEKLSVSQLDSAKISLSSYWANKIMQGQRMKNYYILSESDAEKAMIDGLTKEIQQSAYQSISELFGDFDSLRFHEAWQQVNGEHFAIYRFKGYFNATKKNPEIRVVLDQQNKLAGFWVKPWKDNL
jgi:hypothetical protein